MTIRKVWPRKKVRVCLLFHLYDNHKSLAPEDSKSLFAFGQVPKRRLRYGHSLMSHFDILLKIEDCP